MAREPSMARPLAAVAAAFLFLPPACAPAGEEEEDDDRMWHWVDPKVMGPILQEALGTEGKEPPQGDAQGRLAEILALPEEEREQALARVLDATARLPARQRRRVAYELADAVLMKGTYDARPGIVEALLDRYGEADDEERYHRFVTIGHFRSRRAFDRIVEGLADEHEQHRSRFIAPELLVRLLNENRERPFLDEGAWGRLAQALLRDGLPRDVRWNSLYRLIFLPTRNGSARTGGTLAQSPDAATRQMGWFLTLATIEPTVHEGPAGEMLERLWSDEPARAVLFRSIRAPTLLRNVPVEALASRVAGILDHPDVTPAAVSVLGSRAASAAPLAEALGKGSGAAWVAARAIAGLPGADAEAARILREPGRPEAIRLLSFLAAAETHHPVSLPGSLAGPLLAAARDPAADARAARLALAAAGRIPGGPGPGPLEAILADEWRAPDVRDPAARVVEAEALALSPGARAVPDPFASGGSAVWLLDRDARVSGRIALDPGVWTFRVEGFGEDGMFDGNWFSIGGAPEFRTTFHDRNRSNEIDLLAAKAGTYAFSFRTDEQASAVDRIVVRRSGMTEAEHRQDLARVKPSGRNPRWRFYSVAPPDGPQIGALEPPAAAAETAASAPAADRAARIAGALEAAKRNGEVLWHREDPRDRDFLWIAIRGKFVTRQRLSEDSVEDFSAFVEMAVGEALTAQAIAFTADDVFVGTDRGLLRFRRSDRSWDILPVGRAGLREASVTQLAPGAGGALSVTLSDGSTLWMDPDGQWRE